MGTYEDMLKNPFLQRNIAIDNNEGVKCTPEEIATVTAKNNPHLKTKNEIIAALTQKLEGKLPPEIINLLLNKAKDQNISIDEVEQFAQDSIEEYASLQVETLDASAAEEKENPPKNFVENVPTPTVPSSGPTNPGNNGDKNVNEEDKEDKENEGR